MNDAIRWFVEALCRGALAQRYPNIYVADPGFFDHDRMSAEWGVAQSLQPIAYGLWQFGDGEV